MSSGSTARSEGLHKEAASDKLVEDAKFLIAGATSAVVSRTIAAPLERLKIIYQVQDLATQSSASTRRYGGVLSALVKIGREEGLRGYFVGNWVNILRAIPYQSVQFMSYERFKDVIGRLEGNEKNPSVAGRLAAGSLAGISSTLASYPLDLVRCRLSAQGEINKYKGIWHCLTTIAKEEGSMALFRGMFPTLLGIAPYVALNFVSYETAKQVHSNFWNEDQPGVVAKLALGAVSGTFAQTVTYPLDVMRRRMQMQGFVQADHIVHHSNLVDATRHLWAHEGLPGFYRGLLPNTLKVVPVVSVSFVCYERTKHLLGLSSSKGNI